MCACKTRCLKEENSSLVYCKSCKLWFCCRCGETECKNNYCFNQDKLEEDINDFKHALDNDDIKRCPRCFANLWKEEGCSAVKCVYCKVKFCWECLKTEYQIGKLAYHDCSGFDKYNREESSESDGENVD